jgi:hypothetical protein
MGSKQMVMLSDRPAAFSSTSEKDLRRQIDRSVSRALVDGDYARLLLTDPTVALEDHGCPPQQYRSLRGIRATDLIDFARQAQVLFWIVQPNPAPEDARLPLAAAAAL